MKKIILAIAFLGFGVAAVNAQAPAAVQTTKQGPVKTEKKAAPAKAQTKLSTGQSVSKAAPAKKTDANATVPATATQHLKKDGTPDMRYKENKEAAPVKK